MLKKIIIISILSTVLFSCKDYDNSEPTDPGSEPMPLTSAPVFSHVKYKVVHSAGFGHKSGDSVIINSYTGEKIESCGKTNIGISSKEYSRNDEIDSKCKVKILKVEENQAFLDLLEKIKSFKKNNYILIETDGKTQKVPAHFMMTANYSGSCGTVSDDGGDQHESDEVDCESDEAKDCQRYVDNGWTFVKTMDPCNKYF